MSAKREERSSDDFLPLILLVALILIYLGSLFTLIQIVALRDSMLGEFQPIISQRQRTAINAVRRIRQCWPYSLLPVLGLVVVQLLVRKPRVKIILYLVLMAAIIIFSIIGLSLVSRLPAPTLRLVLAAIV